MHPQPPHLRKCIRVPTWALVVGPVLAALLSNADVLFLALARPHEESNDFLLALGATVPLSLGACAVTLWFLLRLRHEADRRAAALAELSQALDREQLLRRELDHRVRNNLSALLALVGMYEESSSTGADIAPALRGKILALRESYQLISTTHGEGLELGDLLHAVIAAVLNPADARAVTLDGPSVRLTSREANAFAMIAQELLTNAAKHGALRAPGGMIRVTWHSDVDDRHARVTLNWVEQPVTAATLAPPTTESTGLGLSLIDGFATSDLRGSVHCRKLADRWLVDLVANIKVPAPRNTARSLQEIHG